MRRTKTPQPVIVRSAEKIAAVIRQARPIFLDVHFDNGDCKIEYRYQTRRGLRTASTTFYCEAPVAMAFRFQFENIPQFPPVKQRRTAPGPVIQPLRNPSAPSSTELRRRKASQSKPERRFTKLPSGYYYCVDDGQSPRE